jgi:hypothetical protein
MTRDEHLAWAKARALEYLDRGDIREAVASMLSDLSKHPDLKGSGDAAGPLGLAAIMSGSTLVVRGFIEGFR